MQKKITSLFHIFLILITSFAMRSQNLLNNGDFEAGNSFGFNVNGAGYVLLNQPYTGTTVSGNYAFANNPQTLNTANFIAGGDHTSGSGLMMIVDGNAVGGQQNLWEAGNGGSGVCGLTIGTQYTFSYWIKSVSNTVTGAATQADIGVQILNATSVNLISGNALAPLPAAGWQKVVYTFVANGNCANIKLYNNNTSFVGNDFALDDFSVTAPPLPLALSHSFSNPSCPGLTDGTVTGSASSGVMPYTYTLTGPVNQSNTTGSFIGLPPGTYTLSVTDSNSPTVTITHPNIVLTNPSGLTVNPNATICAGSSTTLSVSGSGLPYTWTAVPADPSLTTPNSATPTVSPNQTTTYTVSTSALTATNLITNGDFSGGNTGFTSDYAYLVANPLGTQGAYGLTPNSSLWYAGFSSCTDHTSGSGNMLIADGSIANGGNDRIWCETVTVVPGADYRLSYWVQSVSTNNPANIDVVVNGVSIGSAVAPAAPCNWVKRTYIWNSGASSSAQICLYDRLFVSGGNDFAIDDISFSAIPCTTSKSVTVTVNGALIITDPPAACAPSTVNISLPAVTAGSAAGATLSYWTDAAATIPLANYTAIATSGVYYIKSTLGACSVVKPVNVTVSTSGSVPAPTAQTPVYYCLNSAAVPLTATALPGATLNWYGTNATGGTASATAPTPLTNANGTTTYYVSQSSGTCEGPRKAINVIVNNTTGNYGMFCDPAQASGPNKVYFDWANLPGPPYYHYHYSINGGPPVYGSTNISHLEVSGVALGQTVTLVIDYAEGYPCVPPDQHTCGYCPNTITPVFASIPNSICSGATPPVLPTTSDNGVIGSWSPATVSNTAGGSYVFTPDPILSPCSSGPITKGISVVAPANAGTLNGNQSVCTGSTTNFNSTASGGSWSSSDTTIATVSNLGVVTGVGAGTATITYTVNGTGGCPSASKTRTVTVTAAPVAGTLNGVQSICVGSNTTFSSTAAGGTWTSSNPGVATINASGFINGLAAGTSTITYTIAGSGGCANATATRTVTVATVPNAGTLGGSQNVCTGLTTQFNSTVSGGSWTTSNAAIATVSSSGLVTGVTAGTATITYTITGTGGCSDATATRTVTVTAAPNAGTLSGNQNICVGLTTTYVPSASGGSWSTSSAAIATVNASGLVTGLAAGNTTITYTVNGTGGCPPATVTRTVTVTAVASAGTLNGTQNICVGSTTVFGSSVTGGTWTTSNAAIATINSTNGTVAGIAAGTATMTYTVTGTGGCANATATRTVTVSNLPNAGTLGGTQTVCETLTTNFTSTVSGGTWSSSDASVALVNSASGIVTGVTPGSATITYTVNGAGGCANATATRTVTVIAKTVPTFNTVAPICQGTVIPALPTTSLNGYNGSWTPALNNNLTTLYTFTPTAGQCATTATLTIPITQRVTPVFDPVSIQCLNDPNVPVLPLVSQNGISGTWTPATVSLATVGTQIYTFHPNAGQCVTATVVTLPITVLAVTTPNFPNHTFCYGKTPIPSLDNTSPNGVEGTWSPAVISNTTSGTYTFTPNTVINQCATPQTITVTVIPKTIPNFPQEAPFCVNTAAPVLGNVSPNGVAGTWTPAIVDNTTVGTQQYVFTPNSGVCATTQIMNIVVTDPLIPNFKDIEICKDTTPPALSPVSPNGITGTWTPAAIDASLVGTNPYLFTPLPGECGVPKSFDVTVNEYNLNHIEGIVSNYFDELQVITVIATGPGEYFYQLDYGPLQESNVFQNVTAGWHTIKVIDQNNCGPALSDPGILVINYPKFFTPNNDDYNDTWNINGLKDQSNSTIFIYDRYGKLLKEISPSGDGWDGTYNGAAMPSTDYWFTVDYLENNVPKQFKAHFSLKR